MGLASALSTALTGLSAAETQIDVVGNNLANSQTVGFKASETIFATQFLRNLALGSAPSETDGGTNPRQVGLGVQVAAISPNFTQGTVEISSNPSDLAIQGDGFFIVEGAEGEQLYTRNGIFKTNSDNELVTASGNRLLGFGVDDAFAIQATQLVPITIPMGTAAVAQATQNVFLEGMLTPTGDIADTAEVIETAVLGDASTPRPDASGLVTNIAPIPDLLLAGTSGASQLTGAGTFNPAETYEYRVVFVDNTGTESMPSTTSIVQTVGVGDNAITLSNLPSSPIANPPNPDYDLVNIYRRTVGAPAGDPAADYRLIGQANQGAASFLDEGLAAPGAALDESSINGNYSYVITYFRSGEPESRPSVLVGPTNVLDGRIHITDLPTPPTPPPGGGFPAYDQVRIYRNLAGSSDTFYLVDTLTPGDEFTDNRSDTAISDLTNPANKMVDLDGPEADSNTLLVDLLRRDDLDYENMFQEGVLSFRPEKGGRSLTSQQFTIESTTTVQDLLDFMQEALGIRSPLDDPQHPIPGSVNNIPGESGTLSAGVSISNGRIRVVSNNGVDNAISVNLSAFQIQQTDGAILLPNFAFGSIQDGQGQSAAADFVAYDSLGIPLNVRLTAVLQDRTDTTTTYRWFADSSDNDPLSGNDIAVGTGLVTFDGEGNFITTTNSTVSIDRRNIPSTSPLEFDLDFSQISGLATDSPSLAASRQDGSAAGKLTSFLIGEDGIIRGVFTNGVTRDLGQVRLARFSNPAGLEQKGDNSYGHGVNAGLPVQGSPGADGLGSVIAGAVELSNTDIGQNLVDLVLATTQYRGNTRVISTAQQLLDELLNLRR